MDSNMHTTSSLTLDVKPLEWCGIDGPRTSAFSRSASEEALARMGWKATLGRPKPPECREIVRPNLSLHKATPSVMLHRDDCDCQLRRAPLHHPDPQDEALALDIFSASETYRGREKPEAITIQRVKATCPRELRRRPSSIASFARLFSTTIIPATTINDTAKSSELCHACSNFDPAAVTGLLFEHRVPINAANPSDGIPPLLAAIRSLKAGSYPSSHLAMITLLLDRGADPNAVVTPTNLPTSPTTPLITACTINAPEVVKLLLTRGAAVDAPLPSQTPKLGFRSCGMTALHAAAIANHAGCVDILLAHGGSNVATSFDYVPPTPGPRHAQSKIDTVSLSRRSSISSLSTSSIKSGLMLRIPSSNGPHGTPSSAPAGIRKSNGLDHPALAPIKSVTALHLAAGSYACTGLLLRHGAPTNVRDSQGRTPLHWAVEAGDADIVSLLLDAGGAEVDPCDGQNTTPLGLAVAKAENSGGLTLGNRAAEVEMMRVLLQAGANVDVRCGKASTTLRGRLLAVDTKDRWRKVFGPLLDEF